MSNIAWSIPTSLGYLVLLGGGIFAVLILILMIRLAAELLTWELSTLKDAIDGKPRDQRSDGGMVIDVRAEEVRR